MRVERAFNIHVVTRPYATPTFRLPEQEELIDIFRAPRSERDRHLRLLRAADVSMLRARLNPAIVDRGTDMQRTHGARVRQTSLDGQTRLELDVSVDPAGATLSVAGPVVSIRSTRGAPIRFTVQVTTDAPSLTPLARGEISTPASCASSQRATRIRPFPARQCSRRRLARRTLSSLEREARMSSAELERESSWQSCRTTRRISAVI